MHVDAYETTKTFDEVMADIGTKRRPNPSKAVFERGLFCGFFHGLAPQSSSRRLVKEALYEPLIRQAEGRYQLTPRLLQALVWQESRFDPMAICPAGAAGLAKLMPATARELGVGNWHDPAQSIDGGARHLRRMLDRIGAIHHALVAYNAGPGAVSRAGGIPRNRETPGYVRSVLERWMTYSAT